MSQPQQPKVTKQQAVEALWRKGVLSWMLDKTQKELYDIFHNTDHKIQTWLLPRRSGKTYSLCILAIETCIRNPGSIVKFLSPTKKQVERNVRPLIRDILASCPDDIKPSLKKVDDIYYFPNGSELQMAGSESGNIDSLRGGSSSISIVDEAQDVTELEYAIKSVLYPTTLTTNGKILIAGTPPKDPDHDFLKYVEAAEQKGILVKRTIYDNPRLTKKQLDEFIQEMGGETSEDFQRECLCRIFKSTIRTVVPEFTEEKEKETVKDWDRPKHYDAYVSMDVALKDWTVVLFGYYDFISDKVVIEDEIVTYGNEMHLPVLTKDIIDKEESLWINPITNEIKKPRKRVSDHNLIVINEIRKFSNYKIMFDLADKKEKLAQLNYLRVLIDNNKIIISPKCKTLISHLRNGKWAGSDKETFSRCPQGSHYDGIDALVYFIKAVDFKRNPYPKDHPVLLKEYMDKQDGIYPTYQELNKSESMNMYKKLLNIKR